MLNVRAGFSENTVDHLHNYFRNNYEDDWLDNPLVKEMVLNIDKSVIKSPPT